MLSGTIEDHRPDFTCRQTDTSRTPIRGRFIHFVFLAHHYLKPALTISHDVYPTHNGGQLQVGPDRMLTSFSVVAGPSFNSVELTDEFRESLPSGAQTPEIDVKNSFAVRPGIGLTWTVAPRVARSNTGKSV